MKSINKAGSSIINFRILRPTSLDPLFIDKVKLKYFDIRHLSLHIQHECTRFHINFLEFADSI